MQRFSARSATRRKMSAGVNKTFLDECAAFMTGRNMDSCTVATKIPVEIKRLEEKDPAWNVVQIFTPKSKLNKTNQYIAQMSQGDCDMFQQYGVCTLEIGAASKTSKTVDGHTLCVVRNQITKTCDIFDPNGSLETTYATTPETLKGLHKAINLGLLRPLLAPLDNRNTFNVSLQGGSQYGLQEYERAQTKSELEQKWFKDMESNDQEKFKDVCEDFGFCATWSLFRCVDQMQNKQVIYRLFEQFALRGDKEVKDAFLKAMKDRFYDTFEEETRLNENIFKNLALTIFIRLLATYFKDVTDKKVWWNWPIITEADISPEDKLKKLFKVLDVTVERKRGVFFLKSTWGDAKDDATGNTIQFQNNAITFNRRAKLSSKDKVFQVKVDVNNELSDLNYDTGALNFTKPPLKNDTNTIESRSFLDACDKFMSGYNKQACVLNVEILLRINKTKWADPKADWIMIAAPGSEMTKNRNISNYIAFMSAMDCKIFREHGVCVIDYRHSDGVAHMLCAIRNQLTGACDIFDPNGSLELTYNESAQELQRAINLGLLRPLIAPFDNHDMFNVSLEGSGPERGLQAIETDICEEFRDEIDNNMWNDISSIFCAELRDNLFSDKGGFCNTWSSFRFFDQLCNEQKLFPLIEKVCINADDNLVSKFRAAMNAHFFETFVEECKKQKLVDSAENGTVKRLFERLLIPVFTRLLAAHFAVCAILGTEIDIDDISKNEVWPKFESNAEIQTEAMFTRLLQTIKTSLFAYQKTNKEPNKVLFIKELWNVSGNYAVRPDTIQQNLFAFRKNFLNTETDKLDVFEVEVDISEQSAEKLVTVEPVDKPGGGPTSYRISADKA